jgi:hypothetical protein
MHIMQSRRNFLTTLSAAGAAGALGARSSLADEGPPETTTVRLVKYSSICVAPFFVAEQLLHAEGFTDVRYVTVPLPADVEASRAERSISTYTSRRNSLSPWTSGSRSRSSAVCMSDATSCSQR